MKQIGEGLQYRVFELENNKNRVRKIPLLNNEIARKIHKWIEYRNSHTTNSSGFTFEEKFQSTLDERESSFTFMKRLCQTYPKVKKLLGNVEFLEDLIIEQDRVTILRAYINDTLLGVEFQKELIDNFIELIFECWKYGFSDRVFNFTENTGINNSGTMIQIDCGEIVSEKEDVEELIKTKRWLLSWSYTKDLQIEEVKEYYAQKMQEQLTVENLEKYWKKNVKFF